MPALARNGLETQMQDFAGSDLRYSRTWKFLENQCGWHPSRDDDINTRSSRKAEDSPVSKQEMTTLTDGLFSYNVKSNPSIGILKEPSHLAPYLFLLVLGSGL